MHIAPVSRDNQVRQAVEGFAAFTSLTGLMWRSCALMHRISFVACACANRFLEEIQTVERIGRSIMGLLDLRELAQFAY